MKLLLKKKFIGIFIPIFFLLYLVIGGATWYVYEKQTNQVVRDASDYYAYNLIQRAELIRNFLSQTIPDLKYLSRQHSVKNYLRNPADKTDLIRDLELFAEFNKYYKQVRFINASGFEVIRINWENDSLVIVADDQLQNKMNRPYFRETVKLKSGDIYVSDIDLNIEYDVVEVPFQRVIRFSTPIYNEENKLMGIIVINQYLNEFFSHFENQIKDMPVRFMFLNADGYWLIGPEEYSLFGFMFDGLKEEKFSNYYPQEWEMVSGKRSGSIYNRDGLFVFQRVSLNMGQDNEYDAKSAADQALKKGDGILLNYLKNDEISQITTLKRLFRYTLIASLVILFFISYVISRFRYKEKRYMEELNTLNQTLEDKIEMRTWELSSRNEELKVVNEELESFSYSVSHDLRAPLRHINGFVELLIKKNKADLTGAGQRYLNNIKEAATGMGRLIDDLLNFSRIGRTNINYSNFDMNVLIDEVVKSAQEFTERDIRWEISKLPDVPADYSLLRQVWFNLISNALKYSSKKEFSKIRITSRLDAPGNQIVYSIADNGEGFDMKYSHKLFGTFQRLHGSDEYEGTGIGLAIVRRIIARHGGKTWAEAELGLGAIFYFSLPINQSK